MKEAVDKKTEFGQFNIHKVGKIYVHAEMIGSLKNYQVQLLKNEVLMNVKIGDTVFLQVEDQSIKNQYGTKLKFYPLRLLTDKVEIERFIMLDRERVALIFLNAAQENLGKGWYGGEIISKALILCASQPKLRLILLELRSKRLVNMIEAVIKYEYKETENFIKLCELALGTFIDEKKLNEINLDKIEHKIKKIQYDLNIAKSSIKASAQNRTIKLKEYLNQLQ